MLLFSLASRLRRAGVVGMNARNADFIMRFNPRQLYPVVDDKRLTKEILSAAKVPVPELYAVVDSQGQMKRFDEQLAGREDFVIKPANGAQGDGIVVISGQARQGWRKVDGSVITRDEITFHLSNILSGMYSLAGQPDTAIVEYRVVFDPVFDVIAYRGVPDVRVLVYRGVPVMAMLRLPTRISDGRANLHKGGIGVGVEIATGRTFGGVLFDKPIDYHPDTDAEIGGLMVPHWEAILKLSIKAADMVGLGYLGIDVVLDRNLGPLVLELNARPGLAIQIANSTGISSRTDQVDQAIDRLSSPEQRMEFVLNELFNGA